jgi:hypothetical protein
MERVAAETIPGERSDLKRADDAETQEFDPGALIDAAQEGVDSGW